jgi:hypothetical protein
MKMQHGELFSSTKTYLVTEQATPQVCLQAEDKKYSMSF